MRKPNLEAIASPDRRADVRVPTDCTALVRLSEALTFPCRVLDISLGGAQVRCDSRYALLMEPRGPRTREPEISVALPGAGGARSLVAHCALLRRAPSAEHQMLLGLRFARLDRAAGQLLRHFIAGERLDPRCA